MADDFSSLKRHSPVADFLVNTWVIVRITKNAEKDCMICILKFQKKCGIIKELNSNLISLPNAFHGTFPQMALVTEAWKTVSEKRKFLVLRRNGA